jgi:hypothetical protein
MTTPDKIESAITHLGLFKLYPNLEKHKTTIQDYAYYKLRISRLIGSLGKAPFKNLETYFLKSCCPNLRDFLTNFCLKHHEDSEDICHNYLVYATHSLEDFMATTYLSNFFSTNITNIIECFKFAGLEDSIYTKTDLHLYNSLVAINNIMLVIELANIFYLVEYFGNLNCVPLLDGKLEGSYGMIVLHEKSSPKNGSLTYDYLSSKYPGVMKNILKNSSLRALSCSKNEQSEKIMLIINSLHKLHLTMKNKLGNMENINLEAIYGNTEPKRILTSDIFNNFFKYYIISDSKENFPKEEIEDPIEPLVIIPNLRIPSSYEIMTNPIVIEI